MKPPTVEVVVSSEAIDLRAWARAYIRAILEAEAMPHGITPTKAA